MQKSVKQKTVKHLKGDIKGYARQRRSLKEEMQEDKGLIKVIKGAKNGVKKKKKG